MHAPRAIAVHAAVVLLGLTRMVLAQTATTTTTARATTTTTTPSTTTTTIPPHPFSHATKTCLRTVKHDLRACHRAGNRAACRPAFETAYANCFAAGAGVSCAKRCVTRETTCLTNLPKTRQTCGAACRTTRRRDVAACRRIANGDNLWAGGDASCLATADANYHLCQFVCAQAFFDCRTSRRFCVANCANL
jgi:hypothetical protein